MICCSAQNSDAASTFYVGKLFNWHVDWKSILNYFVDGNVHAFLQLRTLYSLHKRIYSLRRKPAGGNVAYKNIVSINYKLRDINGSLQTQTKYCGEITKYSKFNNANLSEYCGRFDEKDVLN